MNILNSVQPQLSQNKMNTVREMGRRIETLLSRKKTDKLRAVTKDFESLFVKQMLDAMRKTVHQSSLLPENSGEKYFKDMLYGKYAKKIADTTRLGLADMLYKELAPGRPMKKNTPSPALNFYVPRTPVSKDKT